MPGAQPALPTCGGGPGGRRGRSRGRGRGRRGGGAGAAAAGRLPEGAVGGEVGGSLGGDGAAQPLHGQHQGHRGHRHLEAKQRGERPPPSPAPRPRRVPPPAAPGGQTSAHMDIKNISVSISQTHVRGSPAPFLWQEKERSPLPQRARGARLRELGRAAPRPPPASLPPPPAPLPPPSPAPAALTHRHGSAHCLAISSRRRWHGALGTGGCESACLGACVCGACVRESAPSSPGSRSFLLSSLPNDTDSGDLGSCFH